MQKTPKQPSKLDNLKRIDGVAALPPSPAGSASATAGKPASGIEALKSDNITPFSEAGWSFVERKLDNSTSAHPVFRDSDGQVKIDSGSLNVRFSKDVTATDIERLLTGHGLSIKKQLMFAPNLFTVAPKDSSEVSDSVEIARSLEASDKIEYAEPVLIEAIAGRK